LVFGGKTWERDAFTLILLASGYSLPDEYVDVKGNLGHDIAYFFGIENL
jgi:hypothetical protein